MQRNHIDLEKCFDWIDHSLLLYKLLLHEVNGKFYYAIQLIYKNTRSRVKLNDKYSDWFHVYNGLKQGETFSPTLASFYLNDLVVNIKDRGHGIQFNNEKCSILMY